MSFLNASLAIAGAACVLIPIIIHLLFRRKRKPVLWGAMRFIIEAYRRQRRRLTLEQLILLAARCLVILLLAMALGRPVLEAAGLARVGGSRSVYLVIDNALASAARDEAGDRALDRHVRAAERLLDELGPGDRAGLIALANPAEAIVAPPSSDLGSVRRLLESLEPTDAAADFAGALSRASAEIDPEESGDAFIVLLSDFLLGSAPIAEPLPSAFEQIPGTRLLATRPATSPPGNVQIIDVAPTRAVVLTGGTEGPLGAETVRVRLRRTGPAVAQADATTVRLRIVDATRQAPGASETVVRWSPGQSEATAALTINLDALRAATDEGPDAAALVAEIDNDALAGDNTRQRVVALREALRVGVIARRRFGGAPTVDRLEPGDWLRLALRPAREAPIDVVDLEPAAIDLPSLAGLSAVLVARPDLVDQRGWERLRGFVDAGGLLLVFPPTEPTVHLWADDFLEAMSLPWRLARETIDTEDGVALAAEQPVTDILSRLQGELEDLTRPVRIFKRLPLENSDERPQPLLTLQTGEPVVMAAAPANEDAAESGLVIYFTVAPTLDWTDLPAKPLMVPLMQETVRQGVGQARAAFMAVAGTRVPVPERAVELAPITAASDGAIPVAADARTTQPLRRAGLFEALDSTGRPRGLVAVNPDVEAGRTDAQAPGEIQSWLNASGARAVEWLDRELGDPERAESAPAAFARGDDGSPIAFGLLIAALLIALLETALARWFSHAYRDTTADLEPAGAAA